MSVASTIISGDRLFCTAAPDLAPGDLLTTSDHGRRTRERVVLRLGPSVSVPDAGWTGATLYELVFEMIRLREFPHLPSRLDCLYLWRAEEEAREFHFNQWRSEKSALYREAGTPPFPWAPGLYEVEVAKTARIHVANMALISYFEPENTINQMSDRARAYWNSNVGSDGPDGEVLLEGEVRVVRVLDA